MYIPLISFAGDPASSAETMANASVELKNSLSISSIEASVSVRLFFTTYKCTCVTLREENIKNASSTIRTHKAPILRLQEQL